MAAELSTTFPSEGITTRLAGWLLPGQFSQDWALEQLNVLPYQHLLEVGYGSGKMLQAVAKKLKIGFIAGIDHSVSMYQRALKRNRRAVEDQLLQLHIGSLHQLPYPSHYFHTIYGTNIHLSWKDPAMEFLRLSNLLRTGGRLVTILQPQWPLQEYVRGLASEQNVAQSPQIANVCRPSSELLRHAPSRSGPSVLDEPLSAAPEKTVRNTMEKIQEYYMEAALTDIRIRYKDTDGLTGVAITGYKA